METIATKGEGFSRSGRNRLMLFTGIALLLNLVITFSVELNPAVHLDGTEASSEEIRNASVMTLVFTLTVVAAILGFLVALFPFKEQTYLKRYPRAFLLSILTIHVFILTGNLIGLVFY